MDDRITSVLESPRYAARSSELKDELAKLEQNLGSDDPKLRLTAARRLSAIARAELNWYLLPVREYFLSVQAQQTLCTIIKAETELKTRDSLLNTLRHASERFVSHEMWQEISSASDEQRWRQWLLPIATTISSAQQASTQVEAAYLLAYLGDALAWDVFLEVLPRRSASLPALEFAVLQYSHSINEANRAALLDLADAIEARHPRQRYTAEGIRTALADHSNG